MRNPSGWEFLLTDNPSLYDLSIFQPDDELGMVLRPESTGTTRTPEFHTTVRINAHGVRGEALPAKTTDELRILAVGDSFTLGLQVGFQDTFAEQAAARLSERLGHPVRILNAGVDGFGTQAASRLMQRLATPLEVDAVLLTFFLGNDFWDNSHFEQVVSQPPMVPQNQTRLSNSIGGFSAIYSYGKLAWSLRRMAANPDVAGRRRPELSVFNDKLALANQVPATQAALASFAVASEALGLPTYVVLAPPAYAVQTQRAAATLELFGLDPETLDLDAPAAAIVQVTPAEIPVLDLGPVLRTAPDPGALYFTLDGHWTPQGHHIAASAISDFLYPLLNSR